MAILRWLPDHHLSVAASLTHAESTLDRIAELARAYGGGPDDNGPLLLEEVPGPGWSETRIAHIRPIPRSVALLVSDALNALRAALEHTLAAEAEHQLGKPLTPRQASAISMPASATYDAFEKWLARQEKDGPPSLRSGSPLLDRVTALQPFHRYATPEHHPMHLLAAHTNATKHRAPALASARVPRIILDHEHDGVTLTPEDGKPVSVGDVLARTLPGVRVPATFFATIAIRRPSTGEWPVLVNEVADLCTWVRTIAVATLIAGDPQATPLPSRFDITVGHEDERQAISRGTAVTARERLHLDMQTLTARGSLVEIMSGHSDHPLPDVLTAWADSLDDMTAVSHMHCIKQVLAAGGGDQEMLSIVGPLVEEARRFAGETGD